MPDESQAMCYICVIMLCHSYNISPKSATVMSYQICSFYQHEMYESIVSAMYHHTATSMLSANGTEGELLMIRATNISF